MDTCLNCCADILKDALLEQWVTIDLNDPTCYGNMGEHVPYNPFYQDCEPPEPEEELNFQYEYTYYG